MNDIIREFHKLNSIPAFQTMVDPQYLSTVDYCDVLQMNITRKCNLVCKHCHVDAGPHRKEEMSRDTIDACMSFAKEQKVRTIDITGGAPELCTDFEYLVSRATEICEHVIVRTNLTIMLDEGYRHLPAFYAEKGVELVCSLPHYRAKDVDKVRGDGTFIACIEVLHKLNDLGYGRNPNLVLNMVYNPAGAFFPPNQESMEAEYKVRLKEDFDIEFNSLFTLYNNPMGRFGQFLIRSRNMEKYMTKLYDAFNEETVESMMCRYQISVDHDGTVYDCDFNLAAELPLIEPATIHDFVGKPYRARKIMMDKHCYACTAGAGSS
ncbi:MAG: arsenosugar biosynthesis radical SAM protein ArsS [Clostridiales bacterium]|nr:arsenosugar biosynthesis radical SAM protein ArsS [Candidatus Crickella merdequi]